MSLKYQPFQSQIDTGFWNKLTKYKESFFLLKYWVLSFQRAQDIINKDLFLYEQARVQVF